MKNLLNRLRITSYGLPRHPCTPAFAGQADSGSPRHARVTRSMILSPILSLGNRHTRVMSAACLLFASSCFALVTNINSGATHSAVQPAVAAASSGDILLISTGQYTYMWLSGKNLTILGGYTPDFSARVSYTNTILSGTSYCASFPTSTSTVEGLTFSNSKSGMRVRHGSLVTARYCIVENNISANDGAGILVFENSTLVLEKSIVRNNSVTNPSYNGGGAYVYSFGNIIVSNCIFRNNYSEEHGGGIGIGADGYVEIKGGSIIAANTANDDGGGVYVNGGKLYVHEGSQIGSATGSPNIANDDGGGIYAGNSSVILKGNGTALLNSHAKRGGGAYVYNSTFTVYDNADIGYNSNNKTNYAEYDGGGIYADQNSVIALTNANIYACYAIYYGGGIFADYSDIILYNCYVGKTNDIYTNVAEYDGGAIYVEGSNLFINQTTFVNNQAGQFGGAIRNSDTYMIITNSVFINNIADSRAGALCVLSGGAVAYIIDSSIVTNFSGNHGGGIWWNSDSNLTVRSSIINGNEADNDGGGIYSSGTGLILLDDVEMLRNKAIDDGGGIYTTDGQLLRLVDCDIRLNKADNDDNNFGDGGGLAIINESEVEIIAETKVANIGANQAENGGGIYIKDEFSSVDIISTSSYQVTMLSNMAFNDGGAVHAIDLSETTIDGNVILSQCSADNGGGIYAATGARVDLEELKGYVPQVESCTARESGGGIYAIDSNTLVVCDSVILGGKNDGNESQGTGDGFGGGAVAVFEEAEFNAIDSVFEENESDSHGGAIYISNAAAIVRGDVAGGVTGYIPPSIFKKNIATNSASYGGAVHVTDGGLAEFYNTAMISNRSLVGGGVYAAYSEIRFVNSLIAQNYANISLYSGGGVRLRNAVAIMEYCTIANNRSSGVEVEGGGASLIMTNCIVWGHQKFNVTTNPYQNVVFSDIQGGYPGNGNISAPPLFADFPNFDYRLTAGSPCTNGAINIGITNDCIGTFRPLYGGYDMGAYEFIPEPFLFINCYLLFIIYYRRKFNSKN